MSTNPASHKWRQSLAWSAAFRAVGLSVIGFGGWLWLSWQDRAAWDAVSLVGVLALAALAGVAWYLTRARTERRWHAALDQCAELELVKSTDPARRPAPGEVT
jgi:hypothetical protein